MKLLSETDFVSKNDSFRALVDSLIDVVASYPQDVDAQAVPEDLMASLITLVKDQAATIGEAMNI